MIEDSIGVGVAVEVGVGIGVIKGFTVIGFGVGVGVEVGTGVELETTTRGLSVIGVGFFSCETIELTEQIMTMNPIKMFDFIMLLLGDMIIFEQELLNLGEKRVL